MIAAAEAWLRLADTADTLVSGVPASWSDSSIVAGVSASVTVGAASSSVIVPTPVDADPSVALVGPLSVSRTVSFGSSAVSPVTSTRARLLVSPAANVSVVCDTAV